MTQPTTDDHAPGGRRLPTLLIADDDPIVRALLSAHLADDFDLVASGRDADEAIMLAAEHEPDIAIVDVQMPAGGGLRATQEIHARTPATAIVVLSADEADTMVRTIIAAGAITYIRKGALDGELVLTLRQSIEAHARLRSAEQRARGTQADG